MKCFICKKEINETQETCSECGALTSWSKQTNYIFALSSNDLKRFRDAQIKYINHRDEQERIKQQNRIAEKQRIDDVKRAEQEQTNRQNVTAEKQHQEEAGRDKETRKEEIRIEQESEPVRNTVQEQAEEDQQIRKMAGITIGITMFIAISYTIVIATGSDVLFFIFMFPMAVAPFVLFGCLKTLLGLINRKRKRKN